MSRFLVAMFVGATIAAAAPTSASAWHCLASSSNGATGTGLRRHIGKSPVNLNAPVHTPRRLHARGDRKCSRLDPVIVRFKLQTKFLIGHP